MKSIVSAAAMALTLLDGVAAAEPQLEIARASTRAASPAPAEYFTGAVKVERISGNDAARASIGHVSFPPGARTAWHTHPHGQTLVVTAGIGRVQLWGGPVEEIRVGDTVRIPANVKHWHGAAPDSAMNHLAVAEARDGRAAEWMEQVTDAQYQTAPQAVAGTGKPPAQGRQLFGDIAPKFGQLTDDVLFGDVWARPGLSQRDRSLITVSALIAMNRPDQMRGHMNRARQNGVTDAELIETITHLAFYAGWPSAVTAVGVAREVFGVTKP